MTPDPIKIVTLRMQKGYTQEKLAAMAKVTPRTIQRLEAGSPAQIETFNQVAAPLGVIAAEIMRDPAPEDIPDGDDGIILKPATSGLQLVQQILAAEKIDVGIGFEPWPEQTSIVMPLLRRIEELHPHTFERPGEYDWSLKSSTASQVEAASQLNADVRRLAELKPEGLHLVSGQYAIMGKAWRHDFEESCWSTGMRQAEEVLQVVAMRIVPITSRQVWIPIIGRQPKAVDWSDDDAEVPF
jgi:transcriptional regulator with XRE-family HTH domain